MKSPLVFSLLLVVAFFSSNSSAQLHRVDLRKFDLAGYRLGMTVDEASSVGRAMRPLHISESVSYGGYRQFFLDADGSKQSRCTTTEPAFRNPDEAYVVVNDAGSTLCLAFYPDPKFRVTGQHEHSSLRLAAIAIMSDADMMAQALEKFGPPSSKHPTKLIVRFGGEDDNHSAAAWCYNPKPDATCPHVSEADEYDAVLRIKNDGKYAILVDLAIITRARKAWEQATRKPGPIAPKL